MQTDALHVFIISSSLQKRNERKQRELISFYV